MARQPTFADSSATRLLAAEEALRKVQAQAAALEELSEQLSLSVHVLEAEIASLGEQMRVEAQLRVRAELDAGAEPSAGVSSQGGPGAEPVRPARSTDVDGARLVALNMALDGDPRDATDRYLAEHFDIPDRGRLLDEVYAAVGR
jgi:hypothetical protein